MTQPIEVAGYCPMGCGMTLVLAGQNVTCSAPDCPCPDAVFALLQDPETEHVVTIRENGFMVQHPLRERLNGDLHKCELHQELQALGGPPEKPGRYRAVPHEPDADSEPWPGGDALGCWDLERLDAEAA